MVYNPRENWGNYGWLTYGGQNRSSYQPPSSGNLSGDIGKVGSKYYNPETGQWGTITGYNYTDPAYLEAMAGHTGGQAGTGGASTAPTPPPVVDYGDQKNPLEPGIGQLTGAGAVEALSKPGMS
jgi:hypothetical protein